MGLWDRTFAAQCISERYQSLNVSQHVNKIRQVYENVTGTYLHVCKRHLTSGRLFAK